MTQTPPEEHNLPVSGPATVHLIYSVDKKGKPVYRHQIMTHWQPLPRGIIPPKLPEPESDE